MDEIFRIADWITVMRDGRHIRTAPKEEYTPESLVKLMVGRELSNVYPKETVPVGEPVLEVEHMTSARSGVTDISLTVRAGEIVGLAGLMGAGRTETVRTIFGLEPMDSGTIRVQGREVRIRRVADAVDCGIAMASEDRRRFGLVLCRSILENISHASLGSVSTRGFIRRREEGREVARQFEQLRVKATGPDVAVRTLSGGNQQKVVLAKWMMARPKLLILDEPTRGIDVGAKYEIYKLMTELARSGIGIIMISSELPEFIGMCDRAYTMFEGRITGELAREEMTQENIVMLSTGGKK
jgi:inositol transport system ATP-binding protein